MICNVADLCGGCVWRNGDENEYRNQKFNKFKKIMDALGDSGIRINTPIFIDDGNRRRATLTFEYKQKELCLGFNVASSHKIINVSECPLLTKSLNSVLPVIRDLIKSICQEAYTIKKGKKLIKQNINKGDIFICEADNGIDVVLEYDAPLDLNHRMIIFEKVSSNNLIVRIS